MGCRGADLGGGELWEGRCWGFVVVDEDLKVRGLGGSDPGIWDQVWRLKGKILSFGGALVLDRELEGGGNEEINHGVEENLGVD